MARRLVIIVSVALLAGAAALPTPAGARARYTASSWTAFVKVARCSRSAHEAVFHAKMRRVPGSQRMAVRFTLLERTDDASFQPIPAPKLGRWRRSRVGVAGFGYKQAVRNLDDGSVYRVRVDYRWLDEDGKVISRARRRSASCPDETALPNLRVRIAGVHKTPAPDTDRFFVKVMNVGHSPAQNVPVRFSVDGTVAGTVTVPILYAKGSKLVSFRAPECQTWVHAEADPDGAITETSELDNIHQLACQDLKPR